MMETCGMCFVHQWGDAEKEAEYVAPDLLPEGQDTLTDEIAARWEPLPGEPLEAAFAYPFLSPSIARSVLSELGGLAGSTALYWRYGLCLYDKKSRATGIVDELPDTTGYGGQIRVRTRGDGAQTLLAGLVERIRKLNDESGWSHRLLQTEASTDWHSTDSGVELAIPPPIKPTEPELYVSYAWARERKDPLIEELCAALAAQGLHIVRDNTELRPGARISHYMDRLSAGRCVIVVLSEAYLRSEFCMTELYRLYTNAGHRDEEFLRRIVPLVQDDVQISKPKERFDHALYWQQEKTEMDERIQSYGLAPLGDIDYARYRLLEEFSRHVGNMLAYIDDLLLTRDRPTLSRDGFAMVRDLIERAIA
jgi:internalin A